jgi:hypothetical protein
MIGAASGCIPLAALGSIDDLYYLTVTTSTRHDARIRTSALGSALSLFGRVLPHLVLRPADAFASSLPSLTCPARRSTIASTCDRELLDAPHDALAPRVSVSRCRSFIRCLSDAWLRADRASPSSLEGATIGQTFAYSQQLLTSVLIAHSRKTPCTRSACFSAAPWPVSLSPAWTRFRPTMSLSPTSAAPPSADAITDAPTNPAAPSSPSATS